MTTYDAICTGAGPAGATAARALALKGLKVLVLDKDTFPRDKTCGGGLRPDILDRFPHLRSRAPEFLESECRKVIAVSRDPKMQFEYTHPSPIKFDMRRQVFDNVLVEMAKDAGAELLTGHRVVDVIVGADDAVVACRAVPGNVEFRCRVVLGTGGPFDPAGRVLRVREGLPSSWQPSELAVAVAHEYEVGERFVDEAYGKDRATVIALGFGRVYGYAWAFAKRAHINIGLGGYVRELKKSNINELNVRFIEFLRTKGLFPPEMRPVRASGAPIPLRGPLTRTVTDRMMLVGDSAGFVSPVAGDGIYYAMDAAEMAADVLVRAIENGDASKKGLAAYHDLWRKAWGKDLDVMVGLADRIDANMEDLFRYCMSDAGFRDLVIALYMGTEHATKLDGKIKMRFAKNKIKDKLGRK